MSIKEHLALWSPGSGYSVRELLPREIHRHQPRFSAFSASITDRGLLVEATEDLLGRGRATSIHAAAQFGAVLELVGRTPGGDPQRGRQTLWTVQSAVCEARADRSGRASASLALASPPLSLILGLVPLDLGTEVSLVRAAWSELLVSDIEHGLTNRVPGTWTVFEASSREALAAAAVR